jgi:prepilin-type N-terminal cleavage/methylation domain-containing protein
MKVGRYPRGFTIIELLVVIAIIATVTLFSSPRLATLVSVYRLEGGANGLALNLQKVRLRAIGEGKCLQATFDASARTYQVLSKTGVIPCGTTGFTNDGAAQKIDDASAVAVSATASPVFDARGRGATPSVITLTAANGAVRLVAINAAGQVRVQ